MQRASHGRLNKSVEATESKSPSDKRIYLQAEFETGDRGDKLQNGC